MDLYAPINNALANTQSTIVDLMKVFMSNEIAKQSNELELAKLGQTSRGLDLEAERNRQAATKELAYQDRERQGREDALRAQAETNARLDKHFKADETHRGNVFEQKRGELSMSYDKQLKDLAHQTAMEEIARGNLAIIKNKSDIEIQVIQKKNTPRTIWELGKQYAPVEAWKAVGVNPNDKVTPEEFDNIFNAKKTRLAYADSSILSNDLAALRAQAEAEKDPAKKEQTAQMFDVMSRQKTAIDRFIDSNKLSDKLITEIMKSDNPDKKAATEDALTIHKTWEEKQTKQSETGRPSDEFMKPKSETEGPPPKDGEVRKINGGQFRYNGATQKWQKWVSSSESISDGLRRKGIILGDKPAPPRSLQDVYGRKTVTTQMPWE